MLTFDIDPGRLCRAISKERNINTTSISAINKKKKLFFKKNNKQSGWRISLRH